MKHGWIAVVFFMIFGVFTSINLEKNTVSATDVAPLVLSQPNPSAIPTFVGINLNSGDIKVTGEGNVTVNIEDSEPLVQIKEIPKYVTRTIEKTVYEENVIASTKLINKLMPLQKPVQWIPVEQKH